MRGLGLFSVCLLVSTTVGLCSAAFDLKHVIDVAAQQYERLTAQLQPLGHQYPTQGKLTETHWSIDTNPTEKHVNWVDGFFPGALWQLFHHTKDAKWKERALLATQGLLRQQYNDGTHDTGFLVMCSFGEEYEATKNSSIPAIIVNTAHHLASRFNSHVGCIRSHGTVHETKNFLVIVDNMMNLELLFKAAELSKNETLAELAMLHANRTALEHLRPDHSSYQVVNFNQTDGAVIHRGTGQGYSDSSCWSRGQAWLVTGFTQVYGFTKQAHYLEVAENVASYFIAHLPEDGIPWWDFNAPHTGYVPRDVSAGAISLIGLFELYGHTHKQIYLNTAHRIVQSLGSAKYLANGNPAYHLPALLANSTIGNANTHPDRADQSLPYADYYYLKALGYLEKYPIKA